MLNREEIFEAMRLNRMQSLISRGRPFNSPPSAIKGGVRPNVESGSSENYGLLSDLLNQAGNGSTDIRLKLAYVGNPASKGNWSNLVSYNADELRAYPINSPIVWRSKQSVSAGENPPISNSKWELAIGVDMIQNLGNGKHARCTLHHDEGDWIKMGITEIGTYAGARFSYNASLPPNYVGAGALDISTSATSMVIPTSHPASRTITIGTGIATLPNSSTLGSCTDTFSIPTTHPTTMSRNFPTGLSISPGESLTLYGDANNFVVVVAARYNSGTGAFYGASVAHVGTGSFSNWTIKKEKLRRIYRTVNSAGQYVLGLVQSYDSGTGSFTFTTIKNVGTGTVSDGLSISLAREPADPVSSSRTSYTLQTESIGAWFTVTGTGTSFEHKCTRDNRGTGWLYIYADGPMVSSPPADITVDTYNATLVSTSGVQGPDNLTVGTHTYVAISCTSPSGLSANTIAWVSASTGAGNQQTWDQKYNYDSFTADFNISPNTDSVGEFALRYRENADAGDTLHWMPFHGANTLPTSSQTFIVDGVTIDGTEDFTTGLNPYLLKYIPFTTASLTQIGTIAHPQAVGSLGNFTTIHSFDRTGIDFLGTFSWTTTIFRSVGYINQLFMTKAFAKKIRFSNTGTEYTTPSGAEADVNIAAGDVNSDSVLVHSNNTGSLGENNYALANFCSGSSMLKTSAFINNYDATYIKHYPVINSNNVITSGTTEVIRSKWYLGLRGTL